MGSLMGTIYQRLETTTDFISSAWNSLSVARVMIFKSTWMKKMITCSSPCCRTASSRCSPCAGTILTDPAPESCLFSSHVSGCSPSGCWHTGLRWADRWRSCSRCWEERWSEDTLLEQTCLRYCLLIAVQWFHTLTPPSRNLMNTPAAASSSSACHKEV